MSLSTHYAAVPAPAPAPAAPEANSFSGGDAALLLMGGLAGAALTREAAKKYRSLSRKLAWTAFKSKIKSLFAPKNPLKGEKIAGMEPWLFLLLAVAGAAIGVAIFGLWGFIVMAGLAAVIYLLLEIRNK